MIFDALALSRGWLSVAHAVGTDAEDAALWRTVHLEAHPEGVRLTATDRCWLLQTWVPTLEAEIDSRTAPPGIDEAPMATCSVIDPHGRGRGLLGHLHKLASAKDAPVIEVAVRLGEIAPEDSSTLPGTARAHVGIDHPDHERVLLPVNESPFPDWRKLVGGWSGGEPTAGVRLHPDRLAGVAKVSKLQGSVPVTWQWGGSDRPAWIDFDGSHPSVSGLVMPMRWDLERDEPQATDEPDEAE